MAAINGSKYLTHIDRYLDMIDKCLHCWNDYTVYGI